MSADVRRLRPRVERSLYAPCLRRSRRGHARRGRRSWFAHLTIELQRLVVAADELVEVGEHKPDLGVVRSQLDRTLECRIASSFANSRRARSPARRVADGLLPGLAEVEVAREQVDDVVAGAVEALGGLGDKKVDLLLPRRSSRE